MQCGCRIAMFFVGSEVSKGLVYFAANFSLNFIT